MKNIAKGKATLLALLSVAAVGGAFTAFTFNPIHATHAADVNDTLLATDINPAGYSEPVAYTSPASGVSYSVTAHSTTDYIQLRTTGNASGVVVTDNNGGTATTVTVSFADNTDSKRILNLYTSDTAYTNGADLFADGLTYVHQFKMSDTSTWSCTFVTPATYWGLRSSSGALYLDSISVDWAGVTPSPALSVTDIDNLEIGDAGTAVASILNYEGEAAITWSSSDEDVVSINATTGEYTARSWGDATLTASVTIGEVTYTDSTVVGVNGEAYVDEILAYGATIPTGDTTKCYVTVGGRVVSTEKNDSGRITLYLDNAWNDADTDDELMVFGIYSNNADYAVFNSLVAGDIVMVRGNIQNYNGTIEIVNPRIAYTDAEEYATVLNLLLDVDCEAQNVPQERWDRMESLYNNALTTAEQTILREATADPTGSEIEQFASRYDFIAAKYGYNDFIGRLPADGAINNGNEALNYIMPICLIAGLLLVAVIAAPIALKLRKKGN